MKNERNINTATHEKKIYVAGVENIFWNTLSLINPAFTIGAMISLAEMMRQLHLHLKENPQDRRFLH